ncbi:ATP-grasp domain-containing protein [Gemmatimonadota bacterium]
MKVAVVYNRDQNGTINVFGMQNREWYPEETILRVVEALESEGHEVYRIPADRSLLSNLKKFLPKLSKRRPNGIVFNLALGVQGKCRYTHVPAILEVAGIPYTGSSPMGHTLAQDKVVAKQIFLASNLPTPNYRVFLSEDLDAPHLNYPVIVKPRSEAASFGLKTVNDDTALREAIAEIINEYRQPALAEEFIEGREVNVSLLGNDPPDAMPVLELILGEGTNAVYSHESKFHQKNAGRVKMVCPAGLPPETSAYIQELAVRVFAALNTFDYGRVDFRLNRYNLPYILEMNSMASLNPGSSFVTAARKSGLSYAQLINRIVDVAVKRYSREEPDYFHSEDQSSRKQNNRDV